MTGRLRPAALILIALAALSVAACGGRNAKKSTAYPGTRANVTKLASGPNSCAVVVKHDERWYRRDGLYAPHLSDGGPAVPLDVAGIPEPVPQREPRARYGNRSPYTVLGKRYRVMDDRDARRYVERGTASWYGTKFHGRMTSSLEPYDMCSFSAAHKTLPLPSYARVTNLQNGRSVVVRINDRGPFYGGRIIDLSYAAAVKLGVQQRGTARVEVRALDGDGDTRGWFARRRAVRERAPLSLANAIASPLPAVSAPSTSALPPAATQLPAAVQSLASERTWLQIGSFGERANADAAVRRLQVAGLGPVEIVPVEIGGRAFWRVRLGPLAASAAAELAGRVAAIGLGQPRWLNE